MVPFAPALALAFVVVSGCVADNTCERTDPFCDDGEIVTCVEGIEQRTSCGEDAYCSNAECVETSIRVPVDLGPHDYRTEWWYYTGHLDSASGHFGFEVTIFQFLLDTLETYMCHVAVIDEGAGVHYHTDEAVFERGHWETDPIELEVLSCRFEIGADGVDHIRGVIADGTEADGHPGSWAIDLVVTPTKPLAFHGTDGIIGMGSAGGESWYYSRTRLVAEGLLTTPEAGEQAVSGQAWADHQWGNFDVNEFKGWDWWSMQLDDGYEVMLFQFRDWESELVSQAGTIVDSEGNMTHLEGFEDFTVTPLRSWESTHTDGVYPLDWDITITPMEWDVQVRTSIDDQEMHNPLQNYWEGVVTINGARGETVVNGVGFVELTGYATDPFDP